MIHIHTEKDSLNYFSDKNGVSAYSERAVAFAMQGANITRIFFTLKEAKEYYELNKYKDDLPEVYFWDERRWYNSTEKKN